MSIMTLQEILLHYQETMDGTKGQNAYWNEKLKEAEGLESTFRESTPVHFSFSSSIQVKLLLLADVIRAAYTMHERHEIERALTDVVQVPQIFDMLDDYVYDILDTLRVMCNLLEAHPETQAYVFTIKEAFRKANEANAKKDKDGCTDDKKEMNVYLGPHVSPGETRLIPDCLDKYTSSSEAPTQSEEEKEPEELYRPFTYEPFAYKPFGEES